MIDTVSPLEDFEEIVAQLPYWMRERQGKHIVQRLRKFVIEHNGDKPHTKQGVAKPRSS